MASQTAKRDRPAGRLVRHLRLNEKGVSPEQMAWAICRDQGVFISARAIRYIEQRGSKPTPRVAFAIAAYFDRSPADIWAEYRVRVAA